MPNESKPAGRAGRLVEFLQLRKMIVPMPKYWEKLYTTLAEEAERRGKSAPPGPLTHSLEFAITADSKRQRLIEQIVWADRNNLLHKVQQVFDTIPTSGWELDKKR